MPPRRAPWLLLAVPLWAALWIAGLLTRTDGGPVSLVVGFLVPVVVVLLWLWLVAGREEIEVEDGCLTLRRRVGPLSHTRSFPAAEVENLHALPSPPRRWTDGLGIGHAALAFDHGGRTHHFAGGLDRSEARDVARRLEEALRG